MGAVISVNRLHRVRQRTARGGQTGIDKRPVTGLVGVGTLGLDGDRQLDPRHHGGPDKAVYAYAAEDYAWWAGELGRELRPGLFGENLTTSGLTVTDAVLGERWQVGPQDRGPLLEVVQPRTPCATFAHHMGEPRWVARFTERALTGAYLRVLRAGSVRGGDQAQVVHRPDHAVTLRDVFLGCRPEAMLRLVELDDAGELRLAGPVRRKAVAVTRR